MLALARTTEIDCYTRAANEDCINGGPRTRTKYAYDTANRLVSGLIGTGSPQYAYGYDHASNLTSITPNGPTESFSYTSTNTITGQTYDANGSPTVLSGNSYKWDGENRIVRFTSSANNTGSSFTYDGLGRLVRVVDTHGGAITADHSYTWCGNVRCLAHDNTQSGSPVSTQYFAQGAIVSGTSFYYVKDQLGSVTQLVTSTGTIASQYTYDPYGNRTTVSGTLVSDIGYAGYFYHAASGLDFTLHRAYDPTHARWLNRDPIGEAGGINLYAYVEENPESNIDPSGLFLTSVDAACVISPDLCAEIFGQIAQNAGAMQAAATGNSCAAEEGNRVANGFRTAGNIASLLQLAAVLPAGAWGNSATLERHFADHGADFNAASPEDYANQASQFLEGSQAKGLPTKIDSSGTIRTYDPASNTFGSYNPNGTTKTFFKPSSPTYFDRQPGTPPTILGGP
jgi:RHS repeat-associated protein